MDHRIKKVIAKDIVLSNIPVDSKRQTADRPEHSFPLVPALVNRCIECIFDCIWFKVSYMKSWIVYNIGIIIKMPGSMKGVAVNNKDEGQ